MKSISFSQRFSPLTITLIFCFLILCLHIFLVRNAVLITKDDLTAMRQGWDVWAVVTSQKRISHIYNIPLLGFANKASLNSIIVRILNFLLFALPFVLTIAILLRKLKFPKTFIAIYASLSVSLFVWGVNWLLPLGYPFLYVLPVFVIFIVAYLSAALRSAKVKIIIQALAVPFIISFEFYPFLYIVLFSFFIGEPLITGQHGHKSDIKKVGGKDYWIGMISPFVGILILVAGRLFLGKSGVTASQYTGNSFDLTSLLNIPVVLGVITQHLLGHTILTHTNRLLNWSPVEYSLTHFALAISFLLAISLCLTLSQGSKQEVFAVSELDLPSNGKSQFVTPEITASINRFAKMGLLYALVSPLLPAITHKYQSIFLGNVFRNGEVMMSGYTYLSGSIGFYGFSIIAAYAVWRLFKMVTSVSIPGRHLLGAVGTSLIVLALCAHNISHSQAMSKLLNERYSLLMEFVDKCPIEALEDVRTQDIESSLLNCQKIRSENVLLLKESNEFNTSTLMPTAEGIFAHAPSVLKMPVENGQYVEVQFGMREGAWTGENSTDGACFSAQVPGSSQVLWQQCLRPIRRRGDRKPQTAKFEIPESVRDIELVTSCLETCDWDWSYWSKAVVLEQTQ